VQDMVVDLYSLVKTRLQFTYYCVPARLLVFQAGTASKIFYEFGFVSTFLFFVAAVGRSPNVPVLSPLQETIFFLLFHPATTDGTLCPLVKHDNRFSTFPQADGVPSFS